MKVYIDIFTNDELISDSYKPLAPYGDESFADVAFEVESRKIVKGNEDYGIAANTDADEEGGAAEGGADVEQVIDIVDKFELQEQYLEKKDFMAYIKKYMKHMTDYLAANRLERLEPFKSGASNLIKKIVSEFGDCSIYTGKNAADAFADFKAQLVVAHYVGEEVTPRFMFWKDSMREEKC